MMQREFEAIIGTTILPSEWEIINRVYTFHPAIPDVGGKKKIAELYRLGGMGLIRDMEPTAQNVIDMEECIRVSLAAEEKLKEGVKAAEEALKAAKEALAEQKQTIASLKMDLTRYVAAYAPPTREEPKTAEAAVCGLMQ